MAENSTLTKTGEDRKLDAYREVANLENQPQGSASQPTDQAQAVETPEDAVKQDDEAQSMAARLEDALREAKENYDRLLRVSAEFDNYKKRAAREAQEYRKYANESLLGELLTVVDSLERALEVPQAGNHDDGLRQGIELTLRQLFKLLERFAVMPFESEGQPFDPSRHQAMMQEPSDRVPENTVIRQMQKGYTIHDRLLRPAMVVVAKAAAKGGATPSAADATEAES